MIQVTYEQLRDILSAACKIRDNPTAEPIIVQFRELEQNEKLTSETYDAASIGITIDWDASGELVRMEFY